ncbi:hypothetical protein CARUB_v10021830mg [Capsella rubella]|uniref:F-box domain-containing protein n=1 Tax=Capsella rubella TaxID=81985 RepID=R0GER9_9BRAS|nr:putative F-box protein At1g58090 [Capsella rubella]EOA34312.1 hypothetical protein CARUB_v10021830mg [Capsella rubella]
MVRTKKKKTLTVPRRKLPLDIEEEILARVSPRSLRRFKFVCKDWDALLKSKIFVNKNFACGRSEFMIQTHSHIYSINVDLNDDPTIKVTDLCFDSPRRHRYFVCGICDGHLFIDSSLEGSLVWNPLLIEKPEKIAKDVVCGRSMGYQYDGSGTKKIYKIIGCCSTDRIDRVAVLEFATNKWEVTHCTTSDKTVGSRDLCMVSLNGNLYWTGSKYPHNGEYFIEMLDFSKEIVKIFCILPCVGKKQGSHTRALSIYKGDRFSVLQQSRKTGETEIWVTEKKIGNGDDGGNVVWIKFLNILRPDFPMIVRHHSTSYFVDNNIYGKSFVMCCRSKKPKQAWVYIVRGDICKKIKIDEVACEFKSSAYVPSLITISRKETETQHMNSISRCMSHIIHTTKQIHVG